MNIKLTDCYGCRDDFYNRNKMGANEDDEGQTRCWSFCNAKMEKALDIPINMSPPYLRLKETSRPDCYRSDGYVRVRKDRLDTKGYWKR